MMTFIRALIHRYRWLKALRRQGREIASASLLATHDTGTLIVNRTSTDFSKANCWWTADDVLQLAPCAAPDDDERQALYSSHPPKAHDFDDWCYHTYISLETGNAILIAPVYNGAGMAKLIRKRKPGMQIVFSSSAIVAASVADKEVA